MITSADKKIMCVISNELPPLTQCQRPSIAPKTTLCKKTRNLAVRFCYRTPIQQLSDSLGARPDFRLAKLKYLRELSVHLSDIEIKFEVKWDEKSIEIHQFSSKLWTLLARKEKLLTIKDEIHSIISHFCPPAHFMTTLELEQIWEQNYTHFDAQISSSCKSEFKDTHVCWCVHTSTLAATGSTS